MGVPESRSGRPKQFTTRLRRLVDSAARLFKRTGGQNAGKSITARPGCLPALLVVNLIVLIFVGSALVRAGWEQRAAPTEIPADVTSTHAAPANVPSPSAAPSTSATATMNGAIAFAVRHPKYGELYVLTDATHELIRLAGDAAEYRDLAWSPDGHALAYAARQSNNWDVYVLDLAGGPLIRLTQENGFDAGPAWSPDGSQLAFESYRDGNLDIYIMDADGGNVQRLTTDPAPDYAPSWSPDGRAIAFTSYRTGDQDIFVGYLQGDLKGVEEDLTSSPDAAEDDAVWAPDGGHLAYTVRREGYSLVQVTALDWGTERVSETQVVLRLTSNDLLGNVSKPTWSPDGQALLTLQQRASQYHLLVTNLSGWGLAEKIHTSNAPISDASWGIVSPSARALAAAHETAPPIAPTLFSEAIQPTPTEGPPYRLTALSGISAGDAEAQLSDQVDESFNALRSRVIEEAGWDLLSTLDEAWQPIDHTPEPGQSRMNWYICGRAIALSQDYYDQQRLVVTREDAGNQTFWRVFMRAERQDGSMGEPLRIAPWDFRAREQEGTAKQEGGQLMSEVPPGYYVDLTALAAEYGWERVPAQYRWRYFEPDIQWWVFQKTDGMTWQDCLLEVYEPEQIVAEFGPILGEEYADIEVAPPPVQPSGSSRPQATRAPYPFTCDVTYRVPEYQDAWSGAAGYVQDLYGNPLPGYNLMVECPGVGSFSHQAGGDSRFNQFYGNPAAWEQACNPGGYQAMEIRIQLYNDHPDADGAVQPVSPMLYVNLGGSRSSSLGFVVCTLNWADWR